jgi:hypothetical protein
MALGPDLDLAEIQDLDPDLYKNPGSGSGCSKKHGSGTGFRTKPGS